MEKECTLQGEFVRCGASEITTERLLDVPTRETDNKTKRRVAKRNTLAGILGGHTNSVVSGTLLNAICSVSLCRTACTTISCSTFVTSEAFPALSFEGRKGLQVSRNLLLQLSCSRKRQGILGLHRSMEKVTSQGSAPHGYYETNGR